VQNTGTIYVLQEMAISIYKIGSDCSFWLY